MKHRGVFIIFLLVVLVSCRGKRGNTGSGEENQMPKTTVHVVTVTYGSVNDELTFFGTTIYLRRNAISTPIAAYLTEVNIKLGDHVNKGDVLYTLQSKESRALGNSFSKSDTSLTSFGIVKLRASESGVITTFDKQQTGEYIPEGVQLCTVASDNDLAIQVNVPFEFTQYANIGHSCTLTLANDKKYAATFTKALTSMNAPAQTQTILAKCNERIYLPENMIVKISVSKGSDSDKQILPRSCVLADEMMKEFWIMKLINDSTAIKVPVTIGTKNAERAEILSPKLGSTDRIISIGNYGLSDTALVTTEK
jgi:hypothetical protein